MAEVMNSLFGITPESLMADRQAKLQAQAMQYAQADPFQRASANIYRGANQLGGAIGGMLGAQDPEMQKAAALQNIMRQADTTTPEGLTTLARTLGSQGFGQQAMQVMDQAQQSKLRMAQTGKAQAEQNKIELSVAQEEKLRNELSALGPDATEADVLKIVSKYGSADKVLATLQSSSDKAATRNQQLQIEQDKAAAKIQAAQDKADADMRLAQERGATQVQLAQMAAQSREQIAQMMVQSRQDIAQLTNSLKQGSKGDTKLPPSLQKEEGKDLETIDALAGQSSALAPALQSLTPNAQGARTLELGPLKNLKYQAQLAAGNSTPEARAYEALKSAVDTAVNLQVSAEKGVQTDKDVLRFAKALVASYGNNDTEATYQALTRYNKAIVDAQDKAKGRLESRRKSQGVSPYYEGSTQGPKSNVIKLD